MSMAWSPQTSLLRHVDAAHREARRQAIQEMATQRATMGPRSQPSLEDMPDVSWEPERYQPVTGDSLKGFGALAFLLMMVGMLGMVAK